MRETSHTFVSICEHNGINRFGLGLGVIKKEK